MDTSVSPIVNIQPGTIIAGRYEIQERIGAGGMGIVFRAIDQELSDDVVALKLLHPHLAQDETVYRRFRNEVLVARSLTHPNIVRTHDMGRAEGGYSYISMEYVDGVSLKEKLHPDDPSIEGRLEFVEAMALLYPILSGVAYAHGKGVIHRDLKPANVILSSNGEVKLADFGTARILGMDTSITRTGQVVGTPDYMSPEQIRGEKLDPTCDVYSLGIIAYELVTGTRPFDADTPVAVAFKHLNEPLPEFDENTIEVPDWYRGYVSTAAAKKREDRFANVGEMAMTLMEQVPELMGQSGIFPVDGTQYVTATTARSGNKLGTTEELVDDTERTQPYEAPAAALASPSTSGKKGSKFELGDVAPTSSGGWTLSSEGVPAAAQQAPAESVAVPSKPVVEKSAKSSGVGKKVAAGLASLLLLMIIGIRFHEPTRQSVEASLLERQLSEPLANALTKLLAVNLSQTPPSDVLSESPDVQRLALHDELLGLAGTDDGSGVDPSDSGAAVEPESNGEELATEQKETPAPTSAPTAEPTVAPTTAPTAEPVVDPTPAPTAEARVDPTGSLLVRRGSTVVTNDSVSVSTLSKLRWDGVIGGVSAPGGTKARQAFRDKVRLNVFDPKLSSVVARLRPVSVSVSKNDGGVKVTGTFSELLRKSPAVGQYRIDLIYGGEMLASESLQLYKASVSYSRGVPTGQGGAGGTVTTINSSNLNSQKPASKPVKPSTSATTSGQTGSSLPAVRTPADSTSGRRAPTGSQVYLQPKSGSGVAKPYGQTNTPGAGTAAPSTGLPPARSVAGQPSAQPETRGTRRGASPGESSLSGMNIPTVDSPASVKRETYGGTLTIATDTGPEQDRAMILNLEFRGPRITGSASIAGFDPFNVNGKVLTRGIELGLRNSKYFIRLSGGRRDRVLRGTYFLPALNQSGAWTVSRTN